MLAVVGCRAAVSAHIAPSLESRVLEQLSKPSDASDIEGMSVSTVKDAKAEIVGLRDILRDLWPTVSLCSSSTPVPSSSASNTQDAEVEVDASNDGVMFEKVLLKS